jgi:hypothetical protein
MDWVSAPQELTSPTTAAARTPLVRANTVQPSLRLRVVAGIRPTESGLHILLFADALLNASQAPRQSADPLRRVRHVTCRSSGGHHS